MSSIVDLLAVTGDVIIYENYLAIYPTNTGTEWREYSPGPLAPAAKEQIHTIMDYCRVEPLWIYEFIKNEQANTTLLKDQMQIASVDPIFFDMFDL